MVFGGLRDICHNKLSLPTDIQCTILPQWRAGPLMMNSGAVELNPTEEPVNHLHHFVFLERNRILKRFIVCLQCTVVSGHENV